MNTTRYAHITDGVVTEILRPVPGFDLERCFPAEVVAACRECGDEVAPGWTWDGGSFDPPPAPPEPTLEERQAAFVAAIQAHLDAFARTRNYDNILSAATYATSTVTKFRAEGQYAVEARDSTWAKGYEILGEVMSGARPMPTLEEVIAELPALTWPEAEA